MAGACERHGRCELGRPGGATTEREHEQPRRASVSARMVTAPKSRMRDARRVATVDCGAVTSERSTSNEISLKFEWILFFL